ncbi:uncharacterized protein LOC106180149 [Lingula anatina]|uniref:Uncharacterized protein LOC106180149 n=1 Tax=Lingula anatina TaxID=7574 RepID=A0A1S3KA44_LINAN|nr:uncharacterized protein LOC106180149 [Lingula anatina]|eukprot:XP_013419498.1 uncharacterized protein LOC106180149 [Lingula anatina]
MGILLLFLLAILHPCTQAVTRKRGYTCYGFQASMNCEHRELVNVKDVSYGASDPCDNSLQRCCPPGSEEACMSPMQEVQPSLYSQLLQACRKRSQCNSPYVIDQIQYPGASACSADFSDFVSVDYECIPYSEMKSMCSIFTANNESEGHIIRQSSQSSPSTGPQICNCNINLPTNGILMLQISDISFEKSIASRCGQNLNIKSSNGFSQNFTCENNDEQWTKFETGPVQIYLEFQDKSSDFDSWLWIQYRAYNNLRPLSVNCWSNAPISTSTTRMVVPTTPVVTTSTVAPTERPPLSPTSLDTAGGIDVAEDKTTVRTKGDEAPSNFQDGEKTRSGDENHTGLWIGIGSAVALLVIVAVIVGISFAVRKRRNITKKEMEEHRRKLEGKVNAAFSNDDIVFSNLEDDKPTTYDDIVLQPLPRNQDYIKMYDSPAAAVNYEKHFPANNPRGNWKNYSYEDITLTPSTLTPASSRRVYDSDNATSIYANNSPSEAGTRSDIDSLYAKVVKKRYRNPDHTDWNPPLSHYKNTGKRPYHYSSGNLYDNSRIPDIIVTTSSPSDTGPSSEYQSDVELVRNQLYGSHSGIYGPPRI